MKKYKILFCFLSVVAFTFYALPGYAAGVASDEIPWGNFSLRLLNLLIFLGVIYYFAGSKIKTALLNRGEEIVFGMNKIEESKKKAMEELAEVELRIANVNAECDKLLEEGKILAEQMAQTIISTAEKQAQSIIDQANHSAQQLVKAEIEAIRSSFSDKVMAEVRRKLENDIDTAKHHQLIDASIGKISNIKELS